MKNLPSRWRDGGVERIYRFRDRGREGERGEESGVREREREVLRER